NAVQTPANSVQSVTSFTRSGKERRYLRFRASHPSGGRPRMILQTLSALALRELIDGGLKAVGLPDVDANPTSLVALPTGRFIDHGQTLVKALAESSDRAWRALEVALAGEGLWSWLDRAEDRAFRRQVREFLDAAPLPDRAADFRKEALCELRHA